jgi:tetratricopeptide (TPR) repeat protein
VAVWRWRPWLGFLGLSFFFVLAPTSSIVPAADAAFEHRMYLSLASVVIVAVIAVHFVLNHWYRRFELSRAVVRWANGSVLLATVIVYGSMTVWRNADYHSAYRMWETVIEQRPSNPHPYTQIGSMLVADGEYDLAIGALRQALELDPDVYVATLNLSEVLLRVGQIKPAVVMARRAVELEPDRNASRSVLGLALISDGLVEEGLAELNEAVRRLPADPWSHMSLGRGLALAGRVDEGIEELVEALRLGPRMTPAGGYLARVLVLSGDIDVAVGPYRHIVGVDRAYSRAHVLRGDLRRDAGVLDEALRSYQRALEINPSDRAARARLETTAGTPVISSVVPRGGAGLGLVTGEEESRK